MVLALREAQEAVDQVLGESHTLCPFPTKERPILIYGAGKRGEEVFRTLVQNGYRVIGFMDRSFVKIGALHGIPTFPVASADSLALSDDIPHVVVSIFRHDIDISNVFLTLPKLGFINITSFQEIVEHFPGNFSGVLWQGNRSMLLAARLELARALAILQDSTSQQIFLECLKLRMGNPLAMQEPDREHQYFPADLLPQGKPLRLVDCGAYDGDTWASIRQYGIVLEAIVALEPDPSNFARLAARAYNAKQDTSEILLMPCAVWSCTTQLYFAAGSDQNSHLAAGGSTLIQAVKLDDALAGFNANWIKFDIEGAELEALEGARRIIERDRPFLAVAAYHSCDHLWRIPLMLHGLSNGYEIYLRYHGYAGVDMVVYARTPDGESPSTENRGF